MRAGMFGRVTAVDPRLDAIFIVADDGGNLRAVGTRGATPMVHAAVGALHLYGWAVGGRMFGPGARLAGAPQLVWRRHGRGLFRDKSRNMLVALPPGSRRDETTDQLIGGWVDERDQSGGVYVRRGLTNIDTTALRNGD